VVFVFIMGVIISIVAYRLSVLAGRLRDADETTRRQLGALSALVLAVLLVCLFIVLVVIVRPARFFLPRGTTPRARTRYSDAWEEAGRRAPAPPPDGQTRADGGGDESR